MLLFKGGENKVMEEKKTVTFSIALIALGVLAGAFLIVGLQYTAAQLDLFGNLGVDLETSSIHCRIRMYKDGELVFDQYHTGVVTDLGDNITLFKLFGDTDMQANNVAFTENCTFISIGDQGSLSESSDVLPGEWNRTAGTIDNEYQSYLNVSCTFYPDNAGPYTADCIGLNTNSTAGAHNLLMYDTFTEVTGIDETFTINVDFKISVSHS